ncbi:MAG: hypothetical protein IPK26_30985 [Planctomycetes bacterium]|nr:hypothetical protein [Planctomycetota bacterium]
MPRVVAFAVALATVLPFCRSQQPTSFVAAYLTEARGQLAAGELPAARLAVERALERDDKSLPALALLADVADRQKDQDTFVHALHRWLDVFDARPAPRDAKARKAVFDRLLPIDAEAAGWEKLQKQYAGNLLELARQYRQRKDLLGALDLYAVLLQIVPDQPEALAAVKQIRATGGREVAIEDVFAGGDPTGGLSAEEIAEQDRAHSAWADAWTDQSPNYRYRTNAGFLVLKTSAIAMEQVNRFYRRFFHFQEDGTPTPPIEIRIFKSRDEYLKLGQGPPVEWSGGHFIGDAVETYVGGVTGKESIRDMYQTLFHEAAHHFVSMTGPMVPGWLNEAYASFFEGCVILSNGSVRWNQAPPGRLFPLATRMEKGWMAPGDNAGPGPGGEWIDPPTAPTFRMVVAGDYQWGPPWYAPTWGVVYFLHNYRTDDGRPIWRDALHAYYTSFKRGRPQDPIAHFEELVLAGSKLSPVRRIDELDPLWKTWILQLRDRESGKGDAGEELVRWAQAALARKDQAAALEFLDEARRLRPQDGEVLWQLATLLEQMQNKPLAAARYREFRRILELEKATAEPRYAQAGKKIEVLDPLVGRYRTFKQKLAQQGLALARSYEERKLPTMALEIARRMTASYSIPEAMDYYVALATRTGRSLARWRVAYDEQSLAGWSASGDGAYQPYGKLLRALVPKEGDRMVTRELTCDVTFDADFSLSAEMQVEVDQQGAFAGDLVGLCFGRKGEGTFHAVLLHPKGYLDISSCRGGEWTVHDHRSLPVGATWRTLRIDVTDRNLDVYYDNRFVRSLAFADAAAVRGGFGLICGPGKAQFRNIRLLGRDPFDPAARIERELAMAKVMADPGQRTPGTFAGFEPPAFRELTWVQGEATTPARLKGRPALLVFWSPAADQVIPTFGYLQHLQERGRQQGLAMVVLCDPGTRAAALREFLVANPLPGALIAIDEFAGTYEPYFVKAGGFGMPRMLVLDRAGMVVFEGDPGFKQGRGWKAEDGATFVDAALAKVLEN